MQHMFLSLDVRRRIQLIQDLEMPTVSNCIKMSNDGCYIFATGKSYLHHSWIYFSRQELPVVVVKRLHVL